MKLLKISKLAPFAFLPLMAIEWAGTSALAAPVKTKPAVAPKQPKLIREVLGTEQLQGYEGAFGETFTLGKDTPINFTMKSAEYTVGRANIGDAAHWPKGDEKLLVLHFSIQNPLKKPLNFSAGYLIFKAIDANGVTRDYVGDIAREVTGESLRIALNPGQKVEAYTAIRVAAYGEVPKLIVQNWYERQAPIVRYDLRGKVTKLTAPFGDASDASGATAPRLVPAKAGGFYPVTDLFDARLDAVAYTTDPINSAVVSKGKRYCTAIFTLKNKGLKASRISYSYFRADLKDADGEKTDYNTSMLKASRDEEANAELQPGEEARVRFYWSLPEKVEAKTILMQYGYDRQSRTYAFEVPAP
ncbi:hypothetical protein IAD21_05270 [Abditibacteriota bacterium]|nr:hypothetical protein IAD21_05270 [Abditibacteriota bacterium]